MLVLRPLDPSRARARRIRVRDVLAFPALRGAEVVSGEHGVERVVSGANIMQVPTDRFAKRGALLLAAAPVFADADPMDLLDGLVRRRIAGVGIRGAPIREVFPEAALELSDRRGLPLIQLPSRTHLGDLMTELLESLVANQYTALRSAESVRAQLTRYMLSGGGLDGVPDVIADIVRGDAALLDADGAPLASSAGADDAMIGRIAAAWIGPDADASPLEVSEEGWVVWPVRAGSSLLGALLARPAPGHEPEAIPALQHGATTAALQILHEREAEVADASLREGFLRDLLTGSVDPQAAERRASAVGWAWDAYRIVLASDPAMDEAAVGRRVGAALAVPHADAALAVVPELGDGGEPPVAAPAGGHCGTSRVHAGLDELPAGVAEAEEALLAARRFDRRTPVRSFEDLGPLRMLSHVPGDEMEAFHHDVLAPLDELPEDVRSSLLRTLELLLDTGLNVAETARQGGWHYNTVRYRVGRLTELLGPFRDDGTRLESLSLALLLRAELPPQHPAVAGAGTFDGRGA